MAGLAALGAMMVAVYPTVRDSEALKEFLGRFPPAVMSMFGIDPTTFTTGIGYVHAQLDALVNVLDGEAEVVISGKSYILKAGEMIIMPANKPHSLKANPQFKMLLIMIRK